MLKQERERELIRSDLDVSILRILSASGDREKVDDILALVAHFTKVSQFFLAIQSWNLQRKCLGLMFSSEVEPAYGGEGQSGGEGIFYAPFTRNFPHFFFCWFAFL